jgi:S1-C subfamily serine protease
MRTQVQATLITFILQASCLFAQLPPTSPSQELNTLLMHATFRIAGQDKNNPNMTSFGTVFILGIPHKDDPKISTMVLVTAAHVLDDIGADEATLTVRRKNGDGTYTAFNQPIQIRDRGKPLYVKHRNADVAAMYAYLDTNVPISALPLNFLADDKQLEDNELHPGDEVFCLGFPLAAFGTGGFPILRSAHIASYPLTPMRTIKQISLDLFILPGNSGGPVYYSYTSRFFNGQSHLGGLWQGILGLVIQEASSRLPGYSDKSLNFGLIVPAPFIRETIELLPPKS